MDIGNKKLFHKDTSTIRNLP